jgi:hypothetical protein
LKLGDEKNKEKVENDHKIKIAAIGVSRKRNVSFSNNDKM